MRSLNWGKKMIASGHFNSKEMYKYSWIIQI